MSAQRVHHRRHPEYGTGRILDVFTGKPPVYRIEWEALSRHGRHLWGDYPEPLIAFDANTEEGDPR